jgi:hypothetical protein
VASGFPFQPYGLSTQITVGGAAPATVSISVVNGTSTLSLTNGGYYASGMRVLNNGTAAVYINFFASTASISISTTNGMEMLNNTVETFGTRGLPFIAAICASTFTVTLCVTPGEGL